MWAQMLTGPYRFEMVEVAPPAAGGSEQAHDVAADVDVFAGGGGC